MTLVHADDAEGEARGDDDAGTDQAPLDREPVVIGEVDAGEPDEHVHRRHQRAEHVDRLPANPVIFTGLTPSLW